MELVRVNGVDLRFELTGRIGDPVVLVHGAWADHTAWQPVVDGLARSLRVVTYDRRWHGVRSTPSEQGSRVEDEADLAALIERLGLGPAHVVGNSFGASICLGLATSRPDLCTSVIGHEPPLTRLIADDPQMRPLLARFQAHTEAVMRRLEGGDLEGGARQFVDEIAFFPGAWDLAPAEIRQTMLANALTWVDEMRDPDWAAIDLSGLRASSVPVLLTQGDQSLPWFPRIIDRLRSAMPETGQVHTFHGAGHAPHVTHPDEYVSVTTRFIQDR